MSRLTLSNRKRISEISMKDNSISKINNQNSYYKTRNDYSEDMLKNEINQLEPIWNNLGISTKYRNNFINYIKANNILERKDIIEKEKIDLEKTRELLKNLQKEINIREKNIQLLENYNKKIENYFSEGRAIDTNSVVFKTISDIIVELRYNAIKIIDLIINLNKKITKNEETFDLNKLNKEFSFSPKYLNKMKEDLLFLDYSILNKFIETNDLEMDPYLTKYIPKSGLIKSNKLKIPITKELMDEIIRSKNLLMKETIDEVNKDTMTKDVLNNVSFDPKRNLSLTNSIRKEREIYNKITSLPKHQRNKTKKKIFINSNLSRELYCYKKNIGSKNYNDIFYIKNPKKIRIKLTDNSKNKKNNNIVIERDTIISPFHIKNLLIDEKKKNLILNSEINQLKKENIDYKKQNNDFSKIKKNLNDEEKKRVDAEKDVDILQNRIRELSKKNKELLEKLSKNNSNVDNENGYDEKIKNLEQKIKDAEEENKKNKCMIEKLMELLNKKDEEIAKLKKEKNIKTNSSNYKIDFYKGSISDFTKKIKDFTPFEKIPDNVKKAFSIDELIFTDNYYFTGIFPKLIVCKKKDNSNSINGVSFLFYENNEDFSENLVLRIQFIFAIEDLENNIIQMINFIKDNMQFDKLYISIFIDDKVSENQEIVDILKHKLGFKWLCIDKNNKTNKKCLKLYYSRKKINININKNNFLYENYTLLTLNTTENDKELNNNGIKYINYDSIYSLLISNPQINIQFSDKKKMNELTELNKALSKFILNEYNWNNLKEDKKTINSKNININLEESLFKKMQNNNKNIICNIQKKNISINFETNYSILLDDIYYNRISTDKIKILKENKTNSTFYLIPSKDNTTLFYTGEINDEITKNIIDNDKNVYEQFLEFQPSSNQKDVSSEMKQSVIYIPSFIIKNHFYSNNLDEINQDHKISFENKGDKLYLNSVDEYVNIEFRPDENINNSFSVDSIKDKNKDVIIKNEFIIGIFGNDIINNDKLPMIQFLYVKKDNFITKQNYILNEN